VVGGPHFVGRPDEWGKERQEEWERRDYHQPTDAYPPRRTWDLSGPVEDAQLQLLIGKRIGDAPELPS